MASISQFRLTLPLQPIFIRWICRPTPVFELVLAGTVVEDPMFALSLLATRAHPLNSFLGNFDSIDQADASASLNYNVFDLDVGYWFQPNDSISLRTFFGVRLAKIDRDFDVVYTNYGDTGFDVGVNHQVSFEGVGVRVGGESRWNVCRNVSLFGRAAAAVLLGEFDTVYEERNAGNLFFSTAFTQPISDDYFETVPVIEAAIGINVHHRAWTLQAGYELTSWMNLSQRLNFGNDSDPPGSSTGTLGTHSRGSNDLGLDGLYLRLLHSR